MDGQAAGQAPLCVDFTATTFGEARLTRPHHVHDASQPSRQARFRTVHIFVLPFGLAKQLKPLGLGNPSYQTLHQLDRINFSGSDLRPTT